MPPLSSGFWRRFWHQRRLPQVPLAWFRVAFFALLGLEAAWRMDAVPRYGATGFNVAQLPMLDALAPAGRELMGGVYLLQAYLAFRVAAGVCGRTSLVLLTALYGGAYFSSLLDSFQHHYLVFLVLVLGCFVPWSPGPDRMVREAPDGWPVLRTDGWPVRLILVQVSLLYTFAALAKLDPAWWEGATLASQVQVPEPPPGAALLEWVGFGAAAKAVIATELFLAMAIQIQRLRSVATVVGVAFHLGLELGVDFAIGLFSYYMLAFYLLVAPEAWLRAVWRAAAPLGRRARQLSALAPWLTGRSVGVAALLAGSALFFTLHLPFQAAAAGLVLVLGALAWRPLAHLAACAALALSVAVGGAAVAYYESLAGILGTLRRTDEAIPAQRALVALRGERAEDHAYLGLLLLRAEREQEALAALGDAQRLDPGDLRAFILEARIHHEAGRGPAALATAERILEIEPDHTLARSLREHWRAAEP